MSDDRPRLIRTKSRYGLGRDDAPLPLLAPSCSSSRHRWLAHPRSAGAAPRLAILTSFVLTATAVLLLGCAPQRPVAVTDRVNQMLAPGSAPLSGEAGRTKVEREGAAPIQKAPAASDQPEAPLVQRVIDRGTGQYINSRPAVRQEARTLSHGGITLTFADADLREFVRAVLGDILGENYAIDPRVEGTVSIETRRPIAKTAVLPILESVLHANQAALLEQDDLYQIVPLDEALQSGPLVTTGPRLDPHTAGVGIHVVPLAFVTATEVQNLLQPIAPRGTALVADPERNLLLITGTRRQIDGLLNAIEVFDVDRFEGMSFGLYPLRFSPARAMADELAAVFSSEAAAAGGLLRFVALERLNAVLAISSQPDTIDQVSTWVGRLDVSGGGKQPQIFVYYVENGRAVDLADTLGQILGSEDRAQPAGPSVAPGLEPAVLNSPPSVVGVGTAQAAEGVTTAPDGQSAGAAPAGAARTTSLAVGSAGRRGPVKIIADDTKNALVIQAFEDDYRVILGAIRQLDTPPLQVQIEATIAEVTLNDQLRYGLNWFFRSGNFSSTLSNTAGGAVGSVFPGFSVLFSTTDAQAVLNALDSITDVRVISSPQLMALSNETARLQVGDSVPITTQSAVSVSDPGAPIVNSVQFRDTGVTLEVTPRVNSGGVVIMDIEQDVSEAVATTTSGIDSPTIQQRLISSTVAVRSGETVGLGGLIRETNSHGRSGLPFLVRIPILGALFGNIDEETRRTELIVLLTPRVVETSEDVQILTDELQRKMPSIFSPPQRGY